LAEHCHEGVLVCATCSDQGGVDEPAVGTFRNDWDDVIPLCRRHLQQAHDWQAEEGRGDYMRDMAKDDRP
jgi:hypothetical protein